MTIDAVKFFDGYRSRFGSLSQEQVNGLNFLLGAFSASNTWSDLRNVAYALATILTETNHTYQPISEIGSDLYLSKYWTNPRLRSMLGNIQPTDAQVYKGRGYVQITGRGNYHRFGIDTVPENALEPSVAFSIMTTGMFEGVFTGKKMRDFINDHETDYVSARRIINGTDRAVQIAHDASAFEQILRDAADHG